MRTIKYLYSFPDNLVTCNLIQDDENYNPFFAFCQVVDLEDIM